MHIKYLEFKQELERMNMLERKKGGKISEGKSAQMTRRRSKKRHRHLK